MKPHAEQSQANKWSFFEFLVYPGEKKLNTSKRTRTWSHANYATNWCTKNHSWSKVWSSSRSPFFLKLNITHAGAGFSIGSGSQVKLTCYKQGRVVRRREASNSELKVNQSFYCFLPLLLVLLWRRAKRETELVSYGDLDARHSGDGVILLVGVRSYDAHLSVTFISDMQHTSKLCCNICLLRWDSYGSWYFELRSLTLISYL